MRISDDRYNRDRQRLDVALRLIQHEARTQTIRRWTGLTDDRIRKLYRSYLKEAHAAQTPRLRRHRGKSPQQSIFFMRTARARHESSLLASLYWLVGALPTMRVANATRALPGVGRAELLCQAYDIYRHLICEPLISFEHAVFLLTSLARGEELRLASCRDCGALVVVEAISLQPPHCTHCALAEAASRTGACTLDAA